MLGAQFFRSIYSAQELQTSFEEIHTLPHSPQDRIETGCLHQYLAVLNYHDRVHFPLDIMKHFQGQGPDFTIRNGAYFGVEMTKVTTQDYQVWLKSGLNYWPIQNMDEYVDTRAEHRVADLTMYRIKKKNYKLPLYKAAVPDMEYCDLVLEEDGNVCMNKGVLMDLLQRKVHTLKFQNFRTLSLISGSTLFYAFNTDDAAILNAPDMISAIQNRTSDVTKQALFEKGWEETNALVVPPKRTALPCPPGRSTSTEASQFASRH